jgi:phage/plasmid-associated DNA primase
MGLKLIAEAPGILAHLVDGAERVLKRGHFELTPEMIAETEQVSFVGNQVRRFLADCCVESDGHSPLDQIYMAYRQWSMTIAGIQRPRALSRFERDLYNADYSLSTRDDGTRMVEHLGLREDGDNVLKFDVRSEREPGDDEGVQLDLSKIDCNEEIPI